MKKTHHIIFITAGIITLLLLSTVGTSITSTTSTPTNKPQQQALQTHQADAIITCYINGQPHIQTTSTETGTMLQELFQALAQANAKDPYSIETQQLQKQILDFAEHHNLLPEGITTTTIRTHLKQHDHFLRTINKESSSLPLYEGTGREFFCNFVSAGQGSAFPIIILPRLIPIIMTPIPRVFVGWKTPMGVTSCGGLISRTGFLAYGEQQGFALGFWGIGFSIFLPPVMAYGMFGYAIYSKVSAEYMEYYPPNHEPEITALYPLDHATYIPLTTTELQFHISDYDNDLMSYSVTTSPDIGGGNGNNKPEGTYTIPISGLKSLTTYTWTVTVTDGMDTTEQTFTFTTEGVAPIISEMNPPDGERYVPLTLDHLHFYLRDPQNDPITFTVETSPDIGSGGGVNVAAGYVTIPISGLQDTTIYHWFVNATDGTYPTSEDFWFQTEPLMDFNPFTEGWQYRKTVTIDHTMVADNLQNFPVYIHTVDPDLKNHAQSDGDDLLFMDGTGVAHRLWYDLDAYDGSTGTLDAWVHIPQLSTTADTLFYVYYGNPDVTAQEFPDQTWDDPYQGVWHLNTNPAATIHDSTQNTNDGTSHGAMTIANLVPAQLGHGILFDGVDDYITMPTSDSLCPTDVTLSGWYQPQATHSGMYVLSKSSFDYWGNADGHTYGFEVVSNAIRATFERSDSQQLDIAGEYPTMFNQWYYLTLTYDETTNIGSFYINGQLQGVVGPCHPTVLWYHEPWDFLLGASRQSTGSSKIPNNFLNCVLDEVHVHSIARPGSWIATEYINQHDPGSFIEFGGEETGP